MAHTCVARRYLAKCSIKAGPGFSTLCANVLPTTMASSLRIFDLANNPLGKGGSDSLSLFLSLTQSLESLNIVNTNVDLHIVLEPLRLNNRLWTTLTTLDISNNPFSEDAAINLGGFLKRSNVRAHQTRSRRRCEPRCSERAIARLVCFAPAVE